VDDMLRFSENSDYPSFTNVDLNQLIENTLTMIHRQLNELNIQTRTCFASDLPLANGNPTDLQQAIIQILQNAKNAMPEGGELNVGTEVIEGGAIKISIEDTGIGIPEDSLSKVFDLFFTTNDKWSKKGVGLSVADRIIREHKGKINVSSKIGEGSKFTIFLPGVQKTTHLG
jgi:two-component system NtrC family sensor kinase